MPVRVEQHLHLDVARAVQRLLDQQIAAAERGLGLAASFDERRGKILTSIDTTHAAAAAPGRRLDQQRHPELRGRAFELRVGETTAVDAGHAGYARPGLPPPWPPPCRP